MSSKSPIGEQLEDGTNEAARNPANPESRSKTTRGTTSNWIWPIGVIVLVLYAASRAIAQTPDSLVYAYSIRTGDGLFHPHHLLFNAVVHAIHRVSGLDPITSAQIHNVIWASLGVTTLARLVSLWSCRSAAIFAALYLTSSLGYWGYATQVEVYVPSVACILLSAWYAGQTGPRTPIASGFFWALATLYNQSACLLAVPILTLYLTHQRARRTDRLKQFAICATTAGLTTICCYVYAVWKTQGSVTWNLFHHFIIGYADEQHVGWGSMSHFSAKGMHLLLDSATRAIAHLEGGDFSMASYAASIVAALVITGLAVRLVQRVRAKQIQASPVIFSTTWIVVHWVFVLWWLPREEEHLISTTPPLLALFAIALFSSSKWRRSRILVASALLAALISWNYAASIRVKSQGHGAAAVHAQALAAYARPDTVVVCNYNIYGYYKFNYGVDLVLLDDPLRAAYGGVSIQQDLTSAGATLARVSDIRPSREVWGQSGTTNRAGWLRFVAWFVGTRIDPLSGRETHGAIERIDTPTGPLLRVALRDRQPGGVDAVVRELRDLFGIESR